MTHIFPREPVDGWHAGDSAFCVAGRSEQPGRVEKGRVYRVAAVLPQRNMFSCGLALDGIDTGEAPGFYSSRFIKLGRVGGRLRQIADATEYGWVARLSTHHARQDSGL